MESPILQVSDSQFNEVIHSHRLILVDFWAPWCGPCLQLATVVEELASLYQGKVAIAKLNIDEHSTIPLQYGIKTIPTLLIFHCGLLVERLVGNLPMANIQSKLDKYIP